MKWNPITIIHDSFEVGIAIKAFDGLMQLIGAVLVLVIQPGTIDSWIKALTQHELSTDPHDWVANHLLTFAQHYSSHGQWLAAAYLASHGLVKIFLVANLWEKKFWAYPTSIIFFGAFGVYQIYRFILTGSLGMAALTVLDIAVIILTWLEYQRLKQSAVQ